MDDLWPGVAAVCLCLVCITSVLRWTLLMFLLRHDGGERDRGGSADAGSADAAFTEALQLLTGTAPYTSRFVV